MRIVKCLCLVAVFLFAAFPAVAPSAQALAGALIIPIDERSLVRVREEAAVSYWQDNRKSLTSLGGYLLRHEADFGTRPVVLAENGAVDLIADKTIREYAEALLAGGMVQQVWSLNDDPFQEVHFIIGMQDGVYEQGLLYTSDVDITAHDPTVYNDVRRYRSLGSGWYYYVKHYDKVRNADRYRQAAWDALDDRARQTVLGDWRQARVLIKNDRKGKMVVAVTFRTEQDGLLGPITAYFEPESFRVIGGEPRF